MDKPWKRAERKIAAKLGGERVPITGRQRGDTPDIRHRTFSIEVKERQEFPNWLWDAMHQAVTAARGAQIPLVVLHEAGRRHNDDFVIARLGDFRELLAPILDFQASDEDSGEILGDAAFRRASVDIGAPAPIDHKPGLGDDD